MNFDLFVASFKDFNLFRIGMDEPSPIKSPRPILLLWKLGLID